MTGSDLTLTVAFNIGATVDVVGASVVVVGATVVVTAATDCDEDKVVTDADAVVLRPIAFVARILSEYVLPAESDDKLNSSLPSDRTVGLTVIQLAPSSIEYL